MNTLFSHVLRCTGFAAVVVALSACGSTMPLTRDTQSLDLSQQSIALFTLVQTRAEGRKLPWPEYVVVMQAKGARVHMIKVDTTFMDYGEDSRRYHTPLRLALEPGRYTLQNITGTIKSFPFAGTFSVPLALEFEVPRQSVIYLGRICVHMRPRGNNEYRAGGLLPLIDQAAMGISTSTFDVSIQDAAEQDLARFREAFPVLREQVVGTVLLPQHARFPFDREFGPTQAVLPPANACE